MLTSDPADGVSKPKPRTVEFALMVTVWPRRNPPVFVPALPKLVGYPTAVGAAHDRVDVQQYWPD
jgi:hypothetical protein